MRATLQLPQPRLAERLARRSEAVWSTGWLVPSLLVALALGVYLANGHFVESTDTVGNELLPIAVLEHHALSFEAFYVGPHSDGSYPGGASAIAPGAVPANATYRVSPQSASEGLPWWFRRHGQHVVSLYPIGPGLLNTPVFWIAWRLGQPIDERVVPLTHVTTSIVAALSVACVYLALAQVCAERRTAAFLTLAFAFGTAVWSTNSRSLFQHGPVVLFLSAALAALLTRRPGMVALAGLLLGLAVTMRPTTLLILAALALYVLRQHRAAFAAFAALAAIPLALLGWYSWVYWGTPLALGQGQGIAEVLSSPGPAPAVAFVGLLLSPNRGLLVFSPMLAFSLLGAAYLLHRRRGPAVLPYLVWASLAEYGLYMLWPNWWGGHTYGYRFLIDVLPALMIALGACWADLIAPRAWVRGLFTLALLASIYVHGLGATAAPCGFDTDPDNIDDDSARLWDVAHGEIARCTARELSVWQAALAR